mgnify:CR=1 FL=1
MYTDVDAERAYDDDRFTARTVFESDRSKVVLGYFGPDQFIPVHAPASDVTVAVLEGRAAVRDGDAEHTVEPGGVVAVEAGTDRGVRAAGGDRMAALLVTAPPPTDAEHAPVRTGLREGVFDPE